MPAQLDNLDREAAMILYLAGELEPADREAFEQQIAAGPELAAEVSQVRAAQQSIASELTRADTHTRLPASEGVVVRRVSRAIANWLTRRTAATVPPVKKGWPLPWWSYPTTVAASVVIGFLVWSSRQEVKPMAALPEATHELTKIEAEQTELAEWLTTSLEVTADASADTEMERLLSTGARTDELNAVYFSPQREEETQ